MEKQRTSALRDNREAALLYIKTTLNPQVVSCEGLSIQKLIFLISALIFYFSFKIQPHKFKANQAAMHQIIKTAGLMFAGQTFVGILEV